MGAGASGEFGSRPSSAQYIRVQPMTGAGVMYPGSEGVTARVYIPPLSDTLSSQARRESATPTAYRTKPVAPPSADNITWDTSRDLVLMRIMSADEFLGRMDETDDKIRHWSQCEEQELRFVKIKELLGLRGHLQDELLRIQAMQAKDDPDLSCLWAFEASHPRVVGRLRDLYEKSKTITIQPGDVILDATPNVAGLPGIQPHHLPPGAGPGATPHRPPATSRGTSAQNGRSHQGQNVTGLQVQGRSLGTQSTSLDDLGTGRDESELTDDDLKVKHDEEESHVAANFASRIVEDGRRITQEDVDRLLGDHAVSMQALRKRQELEKAKHRALVQGNRERLLAGRARQGHRDAQPRDSLSEQSNKNGGASFYVDLGAVPQVATGTGSTGTRSTGTRSTGTGSTGTGSTSAQTAVCFYVDMKTGTSGDSRDTGTSPQRPGSSGQYEEAPGQAPGEGSGADQQGQALREEGEERNGGSSSESGEEEDFNGGEYDDDFEDESEEEKEDLRSTLKDDLWTTLREREGLSEDAFREMLGAYRDQEEGRRRLRGAQADSHRNALMARLAQRSQKGDGEQSQSADTQTEISGTAASVGTDTLDEIIEQQMEEIKAKDDDFLRKLLKDRKQFTEEEYQDLLRRHLAEVEDLRNWRNADRGRLNEKLRDKLRRRDLGEDKGDDDEGDSEQDLGLDDDELSELGEGLRSALQQKGRSLDPEELQALLDRYRRQTEQLLKRKAAARARTDNGLREKLLLRRQRSKGGDQTGGPDKVAEGVDEGLYQELVRLQHSGQMTEAAFSTLLKGYLESGEGARRGPRRRRPAADTTQTVDRETASTLVQEHHQQTRQIQDLRQREKDMTDQRLRRKLEAKKHKQVVSSENS